MTLSNESKKLIQLDFIEVINLLKESNIIEPHFKLLTNGKYTFVKDLTLEHTAHKIKILERIEISNYINSA